MKFGIVVDSSSDLRVEDFTVSDIDFSIVPLKIVTDDQEYTDSNNVDIDQLLKSMSNSKSSSSSCPSPYDFEQAYKKSDNVICITMTSNLSGTHNSARLAADLALEETPAKKIGVIDSKSTAGSLVLLVEKAVELIHQGKSFDEIILELNAYSESLCLIFTLGSYDNLVKTGRMSNFVKTVAVAMNIKVICRADEKGEIEITKKVRGSNKVLKMMVEMMNSYKDLTDLPVYIHHCKSEENVKLLIELIKTECKTSNIHIKECKALTTFYAMPGGLLISF